MIQHPGENLLSPGYEMHVAATKVLSGQMVDERLGVSSIQRKASLGIREKR